MTHSSHNGREALRTAVNLRGLFRELFALSSRQVELLDREDYDGLEQAMSRKTSLLELLPGALKAARHQGWELHDPATFPQAGPCAPLVREAADWIRRFQAHERYCLGQMLARSQQLGDRLQSLFGRRTAAAGYRVPFAQGRSIDTAR